MSKVALEYSVPGPKKNVLSMVPASVRWRLLAQGQRIIGNRNNPEET
jgi:hypothetical protein